jgi:hypothetical protein
MEHKGNYILLTGLLIITLLISVVGTTFSYFGAANRDVKGETTIQFSNGTLIYSDPSISGGFVNAGETLINKTFTLDGSITSANNLTYKVNLKVDTNTYSEGSLFYTITSNNTSSNGITIQSSTLPVQIPAGTSTIEIGSGSFAGPVTDAKHTYTIQVFRGEESTTVDGSTFSGTLDVTQGS